MKVGRTEEVHSAILCTLDNCHFQSVLMLLKSKYQSVSASCGSLNQGLLGYPTL